MVDEPYFRNSLKPHKPVLNCAAAKAQQVDYVELQTKNPPEVCNLIV